MKVEVGTVIEALERMHRWEGGDQCYEDSAVQWAIDHGRVLDALVDAYRAEKRARGEQSSNP